MDEARDLVLRFFNGDKAKAALWWKVPNPMFGHMSATDFATLKGVDRLLKIIKTALEENER